MAKFLKQTHQYTGRKVYFHVLNHCIRAGYCVIAGYLNFGKLLLYFQKYTGFSGPWNYGSSSLQQEPEAECSFNLLEKEKYKWTGSLLSEVNEVSLLLYSWDGSNPKYTAVFLEVT